MTDPADATDRDLALAVAAALGGAPADALAPLERVLAPDAGTRAARLEPSLRKPGVMRLVHLDIRRPPGVLRAYWLRGVALGALGRYEEALRALGPVLAAQDVVPRAIAAAAHATTASLLRQIGDHAAADPHDREGLELTESLELGGVLEADARLDCLVGSTADAVGLGRLDLARDRLERARAEFGRVEASWRPSVRLRWVETEVALLAGEIDEAASAAAAALGLAEAVGSPRHTAKSAMFAGVAGALLAAQGEGVEHAAALVRARATLIRAADLGDRFGLLPLVWPVRAVLATMPGLALDADDADRHLAAATAAARAIAAGLSVARVATWTSRDPMAAHLLNHD